MLGVSTLGGALPCISRCRSSCPSLPSSEPSSSEGESNVSCNSRSASVDSGSCRNTGEDARERKEGGGEFGI